MMVPLAYRYSSPTTNFSAPQDEKSAFDASATPASPPNRSKRRDGRDAEKTIRAALPSRILATSPATPSKPVVIPTRSRNGVPRKSRDSTSIGRQASREDDKPHDALATPSSDPALPAMTTLPSSRHISQNRRKAGRSDSQPQDAVYNETPRLSISSSSPHSWEMLLRPPDDLEVGHGSFESDTTLGPLSSIRSFSMESMPSLDTDTESLSSTSNPGTPSISINGRGGKRHKSLSTSQECISDHPLLPQIPSKISQEDNEPTEASLPSSSPISRARSSFTSNLTASFRRIRSAAQSFSNFTAPPTQRDDYLARSLLSMNTQFTDERRPLPSPEPPDPALRRYLNPTTSSSPSDFHFHSKDQNTSPKQPNCSASIQLQSYRRSSTTTSSDDKASSPPIFTSSQQKALDAIDGLPAISTPRQREPRENSDFLRVIVLEMNMRKVGKLSDASPGKARLWLPARLVGKVVEEGGSSSSSFSSSSGQGQGQEQGQERQSVPARWAGISA